MSDAALQRDVLRDALAGVEAGLAETLAEQIGRTSAAMQALRNAAVRALSYDIMLRIGNAGGEALIMAVADDPVAGSRGLLDKVGDTLEETSP